MENALIVFVLSMFFTIFTGCGVADAVAINNVEAATNETITQESTTNKATIQEATTQKKTIETTHTPEVYHVKLTAVGDLMVHEWQARGAYYSESSTYDFKEAFDRVKPFIESADIAIGNLETTFGGEDKGYSYYPTFNTPDAFGKAIKEAGFDIVSTANNHCMDSRSSGLIRTIEVLDDLGLNHTGTYTSQESSEDVCIIESNHIKFAFLSYTYGTNGIPVPKDKPYLVNLIDAEKMNADIQKAREKQADIVIVMIHFGNEYELEQNDTQMALVNQLFDAGADVILGSHAHVVQPMEKRILTNADGTQRTGFVIYSLGNFISSQTTQPRDASLILNLEFEKVEGNNAALKTVSFIPTWVQFRKINGRYCVRTLPVYETLNAIENGSNINIIEREITRMNASAKETIRRIYGNQCIEDELKKEYIFE
jgi:poly-gamma-glutamate synthesis protein (capsule biosynthesis protein)